MRAGRKRILWTAVGILALFLIALPKIEHGIHGTKASSNSGSAGRSAQAQGKGPAGKSKVQVAAYVVRPRRIEEKIASTGTLVASEEIQFKSEASGRIVRLPLQEGSHVKQGTLLVKINDADL